MRSPVPPPRPDGLGVCDHYEVGVGRERWMTQIGRVAAPSRRSRVASSPVR